MAIGLPAIMANLATPVGSAYTVRVFSDIGEAAIAAGAVIDRVTPVAFGVIFALTGSIGPIIGQNYGANLMGRVNRALTNSFILSIGYVLLAWAALALAAPLLVAAFDAKGDSADYVTFYCRYGVVAWLFLACLFVANTAFNNLGFPLLTMAFNWGRATLGTIPFVTFGARYGGVRGGLIGIALGSALFGVIAVATAYLATARLAKAMESAALPHLNRGSGAAGAHCNRGPARLSSRSRRLGRPEGYRPFMARDVVDGEVVESRDALAAWLEAGCKPSGPFRVGMEHEKIPFYRADRSPVPYEGERGIRALLEGMNARLGWERIEDGGHLIGLYDTAAAARSRSSPADSSNCRARLSTTAHDAAAELDRHLGHCRAVAGPLGIGFLSLGMSPKWTLAETPAMPKSRYEIMKRYMPRVGTRGLDMMFRTATVQANLDYRDEADMVAKLRVGLALQPAITALYANSPFTDGKPNGFLSVRSEIWRHTDAARTGMLAFAFEPGMGFERYVDYALDVPMYFLKRGSTYLDVAGANFRDLLAGRLAAAPGERATLADWANHLSTIFPEVRLKRYLEMRGADVGSPDRIAAQSALMIGLYYDKRRARTRRSELIKDWTAEDRQQLRDEAPRARPRGARSRGRELRTTWRSTCLQSRAGPRAARAG